jgi:hypothetical protein
MSGDSITDRSWSIGYEYNITGLRLGLQRASGLLHLVSGGCQTEFNWINKTAGSNETEVYNLWDREDSSYHADISTSKPITLEFHVHPKSLRNVKSYGLNDSPLRRYFKRFGSTLLQRSE